MQANLTFITRDSLDVSEESARGLAQPGGTYPTGRMAFYLCPLRRESTFGLKSRYRPALQDEFDYLLLKQVQSEMRANHIAAIPQIHLFLQTRINSAKLSSSY